MTDALNEKPIYVYDNISLNYFKIKIFQIKLVEKIKTHIYFQ